MYYLAVLCCLLIEAVRIRHGRGSLYAPRYPNWGLRGIAAAAAACVVLFAARLALVYVASRDTRAPHWLASLPIIAVFDYQGFWWDPHRALLGAGVGLAAAGCSFALYVLYGSLRARAFTGAARLIVVVAAVVLSLAALVAPAMGTTDPYLYAAYGELGLHAYGPQPIAAPCMDASLGDWCAQPTLPALYGPLYLTYVHVLLHAGGPLLLRIELLRLTNLGWVALFLILLRALDVDWPLVALAALNSAIFAQYVADAHNDILAVDATLAGLVAARRHPVLGLICGAIAALLKLPFALLASVIFLRAPLKERLVWTAATLGVALVLTLAWAGSPYLESVAYSRVHYPFFSSLAHNTAAISAFFFLFAALLRRRISLLGAYFIPTLGARSAYPWYALWSIPYILWDRDRLALFLIGLPLTSFLMETPFQLPLLWAVIMITLLGLCLRELVLPRDVARSGIGEKA